jgi:hypothetical protein
MIMDEAMRRDDDAITTLLNTLYVIRHARVDALP